MIGKYKLGLFHSIPTHLLNISLELNFAIGYMTSAQAFGVWFV